jgi:HlyD family secretion protein
LGQPVDFSRPEAQRRKKYWELSVRSDWDTELESLRIDRSAQKLPYRPRARWISAAVAGIVFVGAAALIYMNYSSALSVQVMRVAAIEQPLSAEGSVVLNATGYIVAHHEIQVASKVSGKVAWIGVEQGDQVKKNQELVRLEDTEYRAQVEQAKGNLTNLESKLAELKHGSRPQEIAQAQANLLQAQADLANSKLAYERNKALRAEGIISRQDFDNAQYAYRNIEAKTDSLEQAYDLVKIGPREEDIDAMRAQVQQARGVLAFNQEELNNTVIRAPIDGCVLERAVEQGGYVTTGFVGDKGAKGYVVTLADLNDLQVELDISQNDFARLHVGQNGIVTTDAYPDRKYDGKLIEISPKANRDKATVQVKMQILHPDAYLRPDMNASVVFVESQEQGKKIEAKPLIMIPASAVRDGNVFVVADGKALRRKVRVLRKTPEGAQIESGLIGGEEVIVNPPANLNDGQKIHEQGQRP